MQREEMNRRKTTRIILVQEKLTSELESLGENKNAHTHGHQFRDSSQVHLGYPLCIFYSHASSVQKENVEDN